MQFKEWFLFVESKEEKALALELAGDALQELNSVIPQNQKDSDTLLLLATYFYNKQKNLNQIKKDIQDYIALVKNNKMPLIKVNLQNKSPDKPFDDYLHWTQVIHGHQAEESYKKAKKFKPSDIDFQNEKPIETSPDGKIRVYKSNSLQQCIILGRGQSFCISQPGNIAWKSYRDTKGSTFYFVYDDTREDELGVVVVDAKNRGIELTDKRNTTGKTLDPFTGKITTDSNSYIKYLKEKGIDTSIFVNLPKTPEEIAEDKKLGETNKDLNWFIALSPTEKSNYIGRGHRITDEQFDYLWNNKFSSLLEQYVKTGLLLSVYQIDKIASNVDLRKNYIHNRMIAQNNNGITITSEEFQYLNKEQINELSDESVKGIFDRAKNIDEIAKLIIQNKKELNDDNVEKLIMTADNKYEIAKLIIQNKKELTTENIIRMIDYAKNKDEMAKLLGSENISKIPDDRILNLTKYKTERTDELIKIFIQYKNELTADNINTFLKNAKNKNEIAKLIIQNKKEFTDYDIYVLLSWVENPDEIKRILQQQGLI